MEPRVNGSQTRAAESRGSRSLSRDAVSNVNESLPIDGAFQVSQSKVSDPQDSESLSREVAFNEPPQPKLGIEDKLDEDFMEILSYIKNNFKNLSDEEDRRLAKNWLDKLCGEAIEGIDAKRSRNIYLSRLASQMVDPKSGLNPPFVQPPPEGNLLSAEIMFGLQPPEEKPPDWLDNVIKNAEVPDIAHTSRDGRTYLATRTMKGGLGAFGYVAVTVAEDEPLWVGAGDKNPSSSPSKASTKRKKIIFCKGPPLVPPEEPVSRLNEERRAWSKAQGKLKKSSSKRLFENIEPLLAKRRTPEERDGLLHFYDILLQSIQKEAETCGCHKGSTNVHIEELLEKLENDLRAKGDDTCICEMPSSERRQLLLKMLYSRTEARKKAVEEREAILDRLEKMVRATDEEDGGEKEEEDDLPDDSLWNTAADQGPSEQNMKRLLAVYPPELAERFVELLAIWRQDIVRRCRNRHETVVAAMKKDLKAEVKLGLEKYKGARDSWMKVAQALQEVQTAQRQAKEDEGLFNLVEKHNTVKQAKSRVKLVNQLMAEFNETQKRFELERQRGQKLKEQLNLEHQRVEDGIQLNEASMEQLQADGEALHNEILALECDLEDKDDRIRELTLLYEAVC